MNALLALIAVGCGTPESSRLDAGDVDSAADTIPARDGGADATATCASPHARGPAAGVAAFCELDRVLDEALAGGGGTSELPGFAFELVVRDATTNEPVVLYERATGAIGSAAVSPTLPVATASAGKMLTALALAHASLHARNAGDDSLTRAATVELLGCPDLPPGIAGTTLSELMHQVSGLTAAADDPCVASGTVPLETCACTILRDRYAPALDGSFAYTPHNFTVAAAMAEHVLARLPAPTTFRALTSDLFDRLGAPATEAAPPRANNWAAAYRISARAYGTALAPVLPGEGHGSLAHVPLYDLAILDEMATPFGDEVEIAYSPFEEAASVPMRYGFGAWVSCSAPWPEPSEWPAIGAGLFELDYATCALRIQSSLGKFGFFPWVDASDVRPYAAILAVDLSTGEGRVSAQSFAAFQMLVPTIRAAIDAVP